MDFLSSILGLAPCLCDHMAKHSVYIHDLEENLQSLRNAMVELRNLSEDVKSRVELAEQQHMMRTREVDGWLRRVEDMERQVAEIVEKGEQEIQQKCLGSCCPKNCQSSYILGKRVIKELDEITEQTSKGHRFEAVADGLPPAPVDELPLEKTVGLDLMYERVCSYLKDEEVGVIGLYGMGFVGKTTLLKKINNDFLTVCRDFEVVIWVVVSKSAKVEKVQEIIRKKLQIPDAIWITRSTKDEKAVVIWKVLKAKRFVLLLDDIWQRINLIEVGIPHPDNQNKSKIVFTTRSEVVCSQMKAQKSIKVECLASNEALALFLKEVGEETLNSHPNIPKIAKLVAEEYCKGLPLALITVGRAMASVKTTAGWEQAIGQLRKSPAKLSGMEDELFHCLKFTYDSLQDTVAKSCFIYCSIFPDDYEINNYKLIELWIGEGFFGEVDNIYEAHNQGHKIIQNLKQACLLESVESKRYCVKMHDVIRDMALWIDSEFGEKKNKILAYEFMEAHGLAKWKEAERISIWNYSTEEIKEKEIPSCPNLQTLIVTKHGGLYKLPSGFFQHMPVIRVLDLSGASLMAELPTEFYKLVNLEYLNLSDTRITELQSELKNLKNLRCLLLDDTDSLQRIPPQVISSLSSLQWFSMYGMLCSSLIEEDNVLSGGGKALMEELECLDSLNDISINLYNLLCVNKLRSSNKLQRCIKRLRLNTCSDVTLVELQSSSLKRMEHLQKFFLKGCLHLEDIKIEEEKEGRRGYVPDNISKPELIIGGQLFRSLNEVYIWRCPKLLNLTWLIYAPSLQFLYVQNCESIEKVIRDDCVVGEKQDLFSRLSILYLESLPRLTSIYSQALLFQSLESIYVSSCMMLRRLPFDCKTETNCLKEIKGDQSWWADLQWEDEALKLTFTKYFSRSLC